MPNDQQKMIAVEIIEAQRDEAKAKAAKMRAEAEKARVEILHERAKIEKVEAETKKTRLGVWFDGVKVLVTVGGLTLSIITFVAKQKDS